MGRIHPDKMTQIGYKHQAQEMTKLLSQVKQDIIAIWKPERVMYWPQNKEAEMEARLAAARNLQPNRYAGQKNAAGDTIGIPEYTKPDNVPNFETARKAWEAAA